MTGTMLISLRLLGAVGGGYGLTAVTVPLTAVLLTAAGMPRSEATILAMMLGFLFYPLLLLWAFSVRSLVRLYAVLILVSGAVTALLVFAR